jgi:two-component system response regulator (stage 0 sporulation protein A)
MAIEQKLNALAAFVLAEDPEEKECARKALVSIMRASKAAESELPDSVEDVGHQFLFDIGADPSLCGYKYVVRAIKQVVLHPESIDSIYYGLYPMIASEFNVTAVSVERGIRNVIEVLWQHADYDVLVHYFGVSLIKDNGKPANGKFLARSALIVRQRLKK